MPGYQIVYSASTSFGRFFTLDECRDRARVIVLGATVVDELFGRADPIGQTVQVDHVPFTVIGVLTPKGATNGGDSDDVALAPLQTAMRRVLGRDYVDWIDVSRHQPRGRRQAARTSCST